MPCKDPSLQDMAEVQINHLTSLLCQACRFIASHLAGHPGSWPSGDLESWWHYHQREDERRIAREQKAATKGRLRQQIKKKLTPEEWEAMK